MHVKDLVLRVVLFYAMLLFYVFIVCFGEGFGRSVFLLCVWVGLSGERVVREPSGHFVLVSGFLPARKLEAVVAVFVSFVYIGLVLFEKRCVAWLSLYARCHNSILKEKKNQNKHSQKTASKNI